MATASVSFKDTSFKDSRGASLGRGHVDADAVALDATKTNPKNIFEAAEAGNVGWITKTVQRSLDYDINQRDRLMRTAMHWAAELGHVNVIECLLDFGADCRVVECNGRSGLHLAARSGHVEVLKALVEGMTAEQKEEMVNQTDNFGVTPLFLAIQKGEEGAACFNFLMDCGARYNTSYIRHSNNGAPPAPPPATHLPTVTEGQAAQPAAQ